MRVEPIRDRIVVKRIELEERSQSGLLVIPDTAKEKPMFAEVVAVGDGHLENGAINPLRVKDGDIVMIGKYAGTEFQLRNEEHLIIREDEILCIVRQDPPQTKAKPRRRK